MKHGILFFLTMLAISSYGQNTRNDTTTSDFKRVQLGISLSPDMCYRTLRNNGGSASLVGLIPLMNETETVKFGYTAGLAVCFNFNKTVGLGTGIQYSNKGYRTKMTDFHYQEPEPNSPTKARSRYNFHYLDMPLKATFTFGKKKVRFITGAGVTTNILVKATLTRVSVYPDHTDRENNPLEDDYKRVNFSPTLSLGIDYKISNRRNLRIEPTFQYNVLKMSDSPISTYLYSGGLRIGYYFGL